MIDRFERRFDRFHRSHGDRRRAGNHDELGAEETGGLNLGIGGRTAAILGDDSIDAMFPHEFDLALKREGAAVEHICDVRQKERRFDGIDTAHQIKMLRGDLGMMSALASGRKKDAARGGAKCCDCSRDVRHDMPMVAGFRDPFGTDQDDRGNAAACGCSCSIGRNAFGEGMGSIDQKVVAFGRQKIGKALRTAEAADTDGNGLSDRSFRSTGQRQKDIEIVSLGEFGGKPARFPRAAEDENAGLVHV